MKLEWMVAPSDPQAAEPRPPKGPLGRTHQRDPLERSRQLICQTRAKPISERSLHSRALGWGVTTTITRSAWAIAAATCWSAKRDRSLFLNGAYIPEPANRALGWGVTTTKDVVENHRHWSAWRIEYSARADNRNARGSRHHCPASRVRIES